jgi:hypothetical protein
VTEVVGKIYGQYCRSEFGVIFLDWDGAAARKPADQHRRKDQRGRTRKDKELGEETSREGIHRKNLLKVSQGTDHVSPIGR